ncbi:MAG: hemerythrin domain-containing protein [Bacteroidetes bacterium]|nr:hemerythrin domain-containing protein [Bacteroidota bacterium]
MDARVEKCLNTNIKDLINEFNEIQTALDKYEIGCAPCSLGTCKLKDVVSIHNLNAENEKQLFENIFSIIYPGESFEIPRIAQEKKTSGNGNSMSPPLRMLVDEHKLIKRILAKIPAIVEILDVKKQEHKDIVLAVADFIKNYADKYHHAKEEDELFVQFDTSLDIIQVMMNDHVQSRGYVAEMLRGVEEGDTSIVKNNLINYLNLLTEHIHKEDDILYPWMDMNMQTKTVGMLYSRFFEINNSRPDVQPKYEKLATILEENFSL